MEIKLWQFTKIIEVFAQINIYRTLIYIEKILVLWHFGKYYNGILEQKTMILYRKLWNFNFLLYYKKTYGTKTKTIVNYSR